MSDVYGPKQLEDLTVSELVEADITNRFHTVQSTENPQVWDHYLSENGVPTVRIPIERWTGKSPRSVGKSVLAAPTFERFMQDPELVRILGDMAVFGSEYSPTTAGYLGSQKASCLYDYIQCQREEYLVPRELDDTHKGNHPFKNPTVIEMIGRGGSANSGAAKARSDWQGGGFGRQSVRIGGAIH